MSSMVESVIEVAFGSVLVVSILAFLLKRWIGVRIDESIKHEYAHQLEEWKSNLALENSRQLEYAKSQVDEANRSRSADLNRFEEFVKKYNFNNGSLAYIRNRNMAEPFEWPELRQFKELDGWESASQEFLDGDIEALRREFCGSVQNLVQHLGMNAFRLDKPLNDLSQIHPEFKSSEEDWKREKWQSETRVADEMAQKVEDSYNNFVRFSKQRLKL